MWTPLDAGAAANRSVKDVLRVNRDSAFGIDAAPSDCAAKQISDVNLRVVALDIRCKALLKGPVSNRLLLGPTSVPSKVWMPLRTRTRWPNKEMI